MKHKFEGLFFKINLWHLAITPRQSSKNVRKISGRLISFASQNWSQSYKIHLVLKQSKLIFNSLTVRYFNLEYTTVLL